MSDTEAKIPFQVEESSADTHDSSKKDQATCTSDDEGNTCYYDDGSQASLDAPPSSASSRGWSLKSDPSDIFQKVIEENKEGLRRWSSTYHLPAELRTYETGQILNVLNQLLIITKGHDMHMQRIATLTFETRDVQQQLLNKVSEGNEQMHGHIQRLESALKDRCLLQDEINVQAMDSLKALEKKIDLQLALQNKLDVLGSHFELMATEVGTIGASLEEMKQSLSNKDHIERKSTEKYVDEPSGKQLPGQTMGTQIAGTASRQFEEMLKQMSETLADHKEMMNSTVKHFMELKTSCQRDRVDDMSEKLKELLEDIKETLGKHITEAMTSSLISKLALSQPFGHAVAMHLSDRLNNSGPDEISLDSLDNKNFLTSDRIERRRSCF